MPNGGAVDRFFACLCSFLGYPRVFGVARAFVAHTDSHFDAAVLCRFVRTTRRCSR